MRYLVPVAREDRLVADFWSLGTLGLETVDGPEGISEIWVYFADPPSSVVAEIIEGRRRIDGADLVDVTQVRSEDWQREYRRRTVPFAVGRRWWVDPREPGMFVGEPPDGRSGLRIPARTAFGTGSHASTALMIELMERIDLAGQRVLDVGTGSGILAMVALASGAQSVVGIDTDPVATFVAQETCRLNEWRPLLAAGGLAMIRARGAGCGFDVIVANVLPSRLRPDFAYLAEQLQPTGALLLSGLLREQQPEILSELADLGLRCEACLHKKDWAALQLEPAAP